MRCHTLSPHRNQLSDFPSCLTSEEGLPEMQVGGGFPGHDGDHEAEMIFAADLQLREAAKMFMVNC